MRGARGDNMGPGSYAQAPLCTCDTEGRNRRQVMVRRLHPAVTMQQLLQTFGVCGTITGCKVFTHKSGRSAGCASVEFAIHQMACLALRTMQGSLINGKPVEVQWFDASVSISPQKADTDTPDRSTSSSNIKLQTRSAAKSKASMPRPDRQLSLPMSVEVPPLLSPDHRQLNCNLFRQVSVPLQYGILPGADQQLLHQQQQQLSADVGTSPASILAAAAAAFASAMGTAPAAAPDHLLALQLLAASSQQPQLFHDQQQQLLLQQILAEHQQQQQLNNAALSCTPPTLLPSWHPSPAAASPTAAGGAALHPFFSNDLGSFSSCATAAAPFDSSMAALAPPQLQQPLSLEQQFAQWQQQQVESLRHAEQHHHHQQQQHARGRAGASRAASTPGELGSRHSMPQPVAGAYRPPSGGLDKDASTIHRVAGAGFSAAAAVAVGGSPVEAAACVSPFACVSSPATGGNAGASGYGPDVGLCRSASRGSASGALGAGQLQQGVGCCSQPQSLLLAKEKQLSLPLLPQQSSDGTAKDTIPAWHGVGAASHQQQIFDGTGDQGQGEAVGRPAAAGAGARGKVAGGDAGCFGRKEGLGHGRKGSPDPLHLQPAASDDTRRGLDTCQQYQEQQQVADWGLPQHCLPAGSSPHPCTPHQWGSQQEHMLSQTCRDLSSSFQQLQLQQQQAMPQMQLPHLNRDATFGMSSGRDGDRGRPISSGRGGAAALAEDAGGSVLHSDHSPTHGPCPGRASDSQLLVMAGQNSWSRQGGNRSLGTAAGPSPSMEKSLGYRQRGSMLSLGEELGQDPESAGMQAASSLPLMGGQHLGLPRAAIRSTGGDLDRAAAAAGAAGAQGYASLSAVRERWDSGPSAALGRASDIAVDGKSSPATGEGIPAAIRAYAPTSAVSSGTNARPANGGGYIDQGTLGNPAAQQQQQELGCKHMRMTRHSSISLEDLGLTPWLNPGSHKAVAASMAANGTINSSSNNNSRQQPSWGRTLTNEQQVGTSGLSHLMGSPTHALLEAACSPFAAGANGKNSQNWQQYHQQPPSTELSKHRMGPGIADKEGCMPMEPGAQGSLFGMTRHSSLSSEQLNLRGGLDCSGGGAWHDGWGVEDLPRHATGSLQDLNDFKEFSFSLAVQKSLISQPFQMPSFFLKQAQQPPASPTGSLASSVAAAGSSGTPLAAADTAAAGAGAGGDQGFRGGSSSLDSSPTAAGLSQQSQQQAWKREHGGARVSDLQGRDLLARQEVVRMGATDASSAGPSFATARAAAGTGGGAGGVSAAETDDEEANRAKQQPHPPGYGDMFHSIWGQ